MTPRVLQNGSKMNATNRTTKKKHLQFQNKKQCGERHGGGSSRSELDIIYDILYIIDYILYIIYYIVYIIYYILFLISYILDRIAYILYLIYDILYISSDI